MIAAEIVAFGRQPRPIVPHVGSSAKEARAAVIRTKGTVPVQRKELLVAFATVLFFFAPSCEMCAGAGSPRHLVSFIVLRALRMCYCALHIYGRLQGTAPNKSATQCVCMTHSRFEQNVFLPFVQPLAHMRFVRFALLLA